MNKIEALQMLTENPRINIFKDFFEKRYGIRKNLTKAQLSEIWDEFKDDFLWLEQFRKSIGTINFHDFTFKY
jgi:hypothetical protein